MIDQWQWSAVPPSTTTSSTPHMLQWIGDEGEDLSIPVFFKTQSRSKRLSLKITPSGIMVTLPLQASGEEGRFFLEKNRPWVLNALKRTPPFKPIEDGMTLPLRGILHTVHRTGCLRGHITLEDASSSEAHEKPLPKLMIPGAQDHLKRRLRCFLEQEALLDLTLASKTYANHLNTRFDRITIKDMRSRWGVCTSRGILTYSWRLILAPSFVLEYVGAHEVCHLLEMNHGVRFWRLVRQVFPDFKKAQAWLKTHGRSLHSYGFS